WRWWPRPCAAGRGSGSSPTPAPLALADDVNVAAPSAPDRGVHPFAVLGAERPERAGVDVVEADAQAATSCASSTVIMTRAMLGRSSGEMKIRDRPLVIARTVMESLSGSLHRAVLATTGRGLVVSCMS